MPGWLRLSLDGLVAHRRLVRAGLGDIALRKRRMCRESLTSEIGTISTSHVEHVRWVSSSKERIDSRPVRRRSQNGQGPLFECRPEHVHKMPPRTAVFTKASRTVESGL